MKPAHIILPILFLTLFWGCRNPQEPDLIRFAFQNRIGSAIPIIAVEKGFFRSEGLNVKPLRFSSGPECAEALYTGSADIGTMGDATAVIALAANPSLTILTSHGSGEHRHRVMTARNSSIRSFRDLHGRTVGIKKGTSTYGGFLKLLEREGMDPSSVGITDLSPAAMTEALLAGSIDAFAASEPTPSVAEERGCREVATLGDLGNHYPILMLAGKDYIEDNAVDIGRFLEALNKAAGFIAKNPEESATIVAEATGLQPVTAANAMKNHRYATGLDSLTLSSLLDTSRFLEEQNLIETAPDFHLRIRTP